MNKIIILIHNQKLFKLLYFTFQNHTIHFIIDQK